MLNRYLYIIIERNYCRTTDEYYIVVKIQRFHRRGEIYEYGNNPNNFHCGSDGITESSWQRLKKLFNVKLDDLDRWAYEWQPTSVVSFITDIAVDTIVADKKEHIVRKYVENQTDGEALHDAIENTYLYSEIKEWITDEGYSQIDWNEVLKRVKNAE